MPQTASMTISQGSNPSQLTVQDTTTSPETYIARTLTITDSIGDPFPGYTNPVNFSVSDYPSNIITLTGLTVDKSFTIVMTQTVASPVVGSIYSATESVATNRYSQQGLYNIQTARFLDDNLPALGGDKARNNSMDIIIEMSNSQTAVAYSALVGAQEALTRAQTIIDAQVL